MKNIIFGFILSFIYALSFVFMINNSFAGSDEKFWVCKEIGHFEKDKVLVISDIFTTSSGIDSEKIEEQFFRHVEQITDGKFDSEFDPYCIQHVDKKEATKRSNRFIEKANKYEFRIMFVNFKYYERGM